MYNTLSDGPARLRFHGQSSSVDQAWHDHVGKQEIDPFIPIDHRQGFTGIAGGKRSVPEALNLGDNIVGHQSIILDDQDRFIPSCADSFRQRLNEAFCGDFAIGADTACECYATVKAQYDRLLRPRGLS